MGESKTSYIRFNDIPAVHRTPNLPRSGPPVPVVSAQLRPCPQQNHPTDQKSQIIRANESATTELVLSFCMFVFGAISTALSTKMKHVGLNPTSLFAFGTNIYIPIFGILSAIFGLVVFRKERYKNHRLILGRFILCISGTVLFSGLFFNSIMRITTLVQTISSAGYHSEISEAGFGVVSTVFETIVLVSAVGNAITCAMSAKLTIPFFININSVVVIVPAPAKNSEMAPVPGSEKDEEPIYTVPINLDPPLLINNSEAAEASKKESKMPEIILIPEAA